MAVLSSGFLTEGECFLLDQINDAVFFVDMNGNVEWANRESFRRLGLAAENVIGKSTDAWLEPESPDPNAREAIEKCIENGEFRYQPTFRQPDCSYRMADVRFRLVRCENGVPVGVLAVSRDMTELNRLENQLSQSQRLNTIGELAGGIAHDINNTLAVILGNVELAMIEPDHEARNDLLQNAIDAVTHGASVTQRVLAYARKQSLKPKSTQPKNVLNDLRDFVSPLLGPAHFLDILTDAGLPNVFADDTQLHTVLVNIIVNARDAMPKGGTIRVEAYNARLDQGYTDTQVDLEPGDYVCFAVSDFGIGLSDDVLAKAFDPFFTTKDIGKGSGLGLSMAFGFAKQSQGHIKIYSQVGVGTTVKLYLPQLKQPQSVTQINAYAPAQTAVTGGTVFVLDDNTDLLHIMTHMLQQAGFHVLSATSIEDAKQMHTSLGDVDLFLLDVNLPGPQNGFDFARYLTTSGIKKPVIFMTGYSENIVAHRKIEAHGIQLIQKPCSGAVLQQAVQKALNPRFSAAI